LGVPPSPRTSSSWSLSLTALASFFDFDDDDDASFFFVAGSVVVVVEVDSFIESIDISDDDDNDDAVDTVLETKARIITALATPRTNKKSFPFPLVVMLFFPEEEEKWKGVVVSSSKSKSKGADTVDDDKDQEEEVLGDGTPKHLCCNQYVPSLCCPLNVCGYCY